MDPAQVSSTNHFNVGDLVIVLTGPETNCVEPVNPPRTITTDPVNKIGKITEVHTRYPMVVYTVNTNQETWGYREEQLELFYSI